MEMQDIIKNRVSLRVYDDRDISEEHLDKILEAAMLSPTAGNQMLYSIIVIRDEKTKELLSKSCDNQAFIKKAPVLLVFAADQHKWFKYYEENGVKEFAENCEGLKWEEPTEADLLLSMEDTMIAAQSAALMAESLGIGSCYIGDILENYEYHKELLKLPSHVVPVALLCLGYYKEGHNRVHRKRFDRKFVVFEESYRDLSASELSEMFSENEEIYKRTRKAGAESAASPGEADNFAKAFYKRKTGAAFSKEMARSVRAMLADYTGRADLINR